MISVMVIGSAVVSGVVVAFGQKKKSTKSESSVTDKLDSILLENSSHNCFKDH